MCNKYVVKFFLGKLTYGKIEIFEIHVEANNEEQAKEIAKMQLKYGQKLGQKPRIFAVELDNS
jgi:hypothetical protein